MSERRYGKPQDNSNADDFFHLGRSSTSDGFTYSENGLYGGELPKWDLLASWANVNISPEDKKTERLVTRFVNALQKNLSTPGSNRVVSCAIDIVKPLLEDLQVSEKNQRWVKNEIKNMCSDVAGYGSNPYRQPRGDRYITSIREREVEYYCRKAGRYYAIPSEDLWLNVNYTAGIEGLPEENDIINTRKSSIGLVHLLLTSFLLHLAMFHIPCLDYRDPNIKEGIWAIQTILRWAGRLKREHRNPEKDNSEQLFADQMAIGHLPDIDQAFREHYAKVDIMLRQPYWENGKVDNGDVDEYWSEEESCYWNDENTLEKQLGYFYSLLGRRILVLATSYYGRGYQLRKMEPFQSWDYRSLASRAIVPVFERLEVSKDALIGGKDRVRNTQIKDLNYPHRVIDTATLEFETEYALYKDRYVIFSHTWTQRGSEILFAEAEQVLLKGKESRLGKLIGELKKQSDSQAAEKLKEATIRMETLHATIRSRAPLSRSSELSAHKLLCAIEAAGNLNYRYIWLDNCCINKANKEEEIEAIPNMGHWYANAQVCLVYLEDFDRSELAQALDGYEQSVRWTERSWTLQEIVLCRFAVIYNRSWRILYDNRKSDNITGEKEAIARLCKVPTELFCCGKPPNVPACTVLELAAPRKATRPEDRAYSLLGILGVRMNPNYGEGLPAAIARLFKLIVEVKNDVSIFNWRDTDLTAHAAPGHSMYPSDFVRGMYMDYEGNRDVDYEAKSPLAITSSGIKTKFDLIELPRVEISPNTKDAVTILKGIEEVVRKSGGALPSLVTINCTVFIEDATTDGRVISFDFPLQCDIYILLNKFSRSSEFGNLWVLSKFSEVAGSNWFLLEIAEEHFRARDRALSLVGALGEHVIGSVDLLQYLESSGLRARRIGTLSNSELREILKSYGIKIGSQNLRTKTLNLIVE